MVNMGTETVTNIWNITIQNIISLTSLKAKKKKKKVKLFLHLQGSSIFPCADLCWFYRDWAALLKPLRGRCIPQEGECVSGQSEPAHGALLQSRNTPGYHQWGKNKAYFTHVIFMCLSFTVNHAMNKVEDAFLIAKNFIGNTKQKQLPWLPHIFYPHKIQLHINGIFQSNQRALLLSELFRVKLKLHKK